MEEGRKTWVLRRAPIHFSNPKMLVFLIDLKKIAVNGASVKKVMDQFSNSQHRKVILGAGDGSSAEYI